MEDALKRLQILMGDTLQILDHMIVDSKHDQMLQEIVNGLKEQEGNLKNLSRNNVDEAVSITQNLNRINQTVQQLEGHLLDDYQQTTGNNIEQYENMSLDEQRNQTETYHDKIDYLSAVKIRENINRMNELLLQISD